MASANTVKQWLKMALTLMGVTRNLIVISKIRLDMMSAGLKIEKRSAARNNMILRLQELN